MCAAIADYPDLGEILGPVRSAVRQQGLTNRVFRLDAVSGPYALRLPRPGSGARIDREAEAYNLQLAGDLEIAVAPAFHHPASGILLTPWAGPNMAPRPEELGRLLARLHGAPFGFRGTIRPNGLIAGQKEMLSGHGDLFAVFLPLAQRLDRPGAGGPSESLVVPSHGDPGPGNCIDTPDGLRLIDWEFSAMAPASWDLAYAILENDWAAEEERAFLSAYAGDWQDLEDLARQVGIMKPRCDAVSALWALNQAALENDATDFLTFAEARVERALSMLETISGLG